MTTPHCFYCGTSTTGERMCQHCREWGRNVAVTCENRGLTRYNGSAALTANEAARATAAKRSSGLTITSKE